MVRLTRWVLCHRRVVVIGWVLLTFIGMGVAGPTGKRLSQEYSVAGREGWETTRALSDTFHRGGNTPPLIVSVALPPGTSAGDARVGSGLRAVTRRVTRALPGARVVSHAGDPSPALVSRDGRTTFMVID